MNYKKRDFVILTMVRGQGWTEDGSMDKFCGSIIQISSINDGQIKFIDMECWFFIPEDILRMATNNEIIAYQRGIRNIKDLIQLPLPIFN